jgi:transposase
MFVKITRSKNFKYVRLVHSFREGNKIKHEVIANLGRLDQFENNPSWQNAIKKLGEIAGIKSNNIESCSEATITNWGYLVYKKLWKIFKLDHILPEIQSVQGKSEFDLNNACFLMTIQHLLSPTSKLGTYHKQQRYTNFSDVDLNHMYRSLDILCENKELIESHLFRMNQDLFNMKVDVVFYDVTTFHFESVRKDSLRDFGYSKNAKFNEVQVVLGMLVDCEGRPIGYELFPGNTTEGKTLEAALNSIEKRFSIRRVIIVADRGINSKINLKTITDKGYGYIFSARIKNMSDNIKSTILSQENYITLNKNNEDEIIKYKIIDYANVIKIENPNYLKTNKENKRFKFTLSENLVITYSDKRAKKDRADRERLLKKAKEYLGDKGKIRNSNKRNGKKYIKELGEADWTLDLEAIEEDEKWDGYYGIQTSEKKLSVEQITSAYRTLYKIEESFRIMKSTLEVRPIYHWTENRIKGHFVISFLAFLLERTLEYKLKNAKIPASPERIRDAINSMQFAEVEVDGKSYLVKTKSDELSSKILRHLKIQPPKNIVSTAEFVH